MKTINYIGYNEPTGYGTASASLIHALQKEGIRIQRTLIVPGRVENGGTLVLDEAQKGADAIIVHTVPEYYPYWIRNRAITHPRAPIWGYTAWETDRIPAHWAELLNGMQGVFVPSHWNREVLQSCGVTVPVVVLPHVSEFQGKIPESPPSPHLAKALEQTAGNFTFYCISMWNERKNIPPLIRAFLEEFEQEEKVSLLLKTDHRDWTTYRPKWRRLLQRSAFGSSKQAFRKLVSNHPNRSKIIHVADHLSSADLAWLHHKGDCFVSCTHGEGWGMGSYEAAWYGKAVAITSYGGQLDYLSAEEAYLMPYKLGAVETAFGRPSYSGDQKWAEVDIADVRTTLRKIYANQSEAKEKGKLLGIKVAQVFSNQRIANTCIEVLFS